MRFDVISVFPEFFGVLNLSLLGKAQERGILRIRSHDLRDWTDDPHRTVDDTPAGGGAGMVMRPDVWGRALDSVLPGGGTQILAPGTVLAIPTPSGKQLTQRECERLASSSRQIVIACGRYEGIDSRVAQHYASKGVEVFEYSLGDYVLNGGEVAAVALVEAIGRLLPGMVGNPESLVEESHGAAGLLEYPVFTRPAQWRDLPIPDVLTSGNHGAVARWRRDRAIEKTAARRPDMILKLDAAKLDKKDKETLAELGYLVPPGAEHPIPVSARLACAQDISRLAEIAARTFPDAAPIELSEESIASFVRQNLSEEAFASYLSDPAWVCVLLTTSGGQVVGYTLSEVPAADGVAGDEAGAPSDAMVEGRERRGPLVYLSKYYIDRPWRGTGASRLLWSATRQELSRRTREWENPVVYLGTNAKNRRAIKAYRKLGFVKVGMRHFMVGDQDNLDVVLARELHVP
ncbi:tRNA (guanosine(37)-N1)-methyltransferase TrmD [Actinomycetaceae bacterium L2_0104]